MDRRSGLLLRQINNTENHLSKQWNKTVLHPVQTWEWGIFREKTGLKIIRLGVFQKNKLIQGFQISIHKIPHTSWTVGYLPKCPPITPQVVNRLHAIGREQKCIFIQIEPHAIKSSKLYNIRGLRPSIHPTFAKYSFVIDVTKSEQELLAAMHPKTRYNIRLAQKHGVIVQEHKDEKGFETFLKLYFETIKRQRYFGHTPKYHQLLWETFQQAGIARILIAYYSPATEIPRIPLTAWIIFSLNDTIYYPYGGSSDQYKNVMASNLVAWEAIRLAKKVGAKYLDLWGCLGPEANQNHPWYGFHRFKQGFGGALVEYADAQDLILQPSLYHLFHTANKLRWFLLKLKPF